MTEPFAVGLTNDFLDPQGKLACRDIGRMNCSQAVRLSRGELPERLVNREVLERPGFRRKLEGRREIR